VEKEEGIYDWLPCSVIVFYIVWSWSEKMAKSSTCASSKGAFQPVRSF